MAKLRSWINPVLRGVNNARCRAWDLVHGVDTCGDIPLSALDFQSENKAPGLEYQSHHPRLTRAVLDRLQIDHCQYSFIDFGCGKGRVLLVASEFPYRKIVGVEFAPSLVEVAKRNLRRYRSAQQKCRDIKVIACDATEYVLPPGPAVLYFYSPFPPPVMRRVLHNVQSSFEQSPRDLLILYSGVLKMRDRAYSSFPGWSRSQYNQYFDLFRPRLANRNPPTR